MFALIVVAPIDSVWYFRGVAMPVMWTWGHIKAFKTQEEAILYGKKNYPENWNPSPIRIMVARHLLQGIFNAYLGSAHVVREPNGRAQIVPTSTVLKKSQRPGDDEILPFIGGLKSGNFAEFRYSH